MDNWNGTIKKIPYGMSNFEEIRESNFLYVDKTKYIENLERENSRYQFFIRPRRFGKSLFISMLENYYDINKKDKFRNIFGGLYIGENPTPEKNSYLVLKLSFASIVTKSGEEKLIESFDEAVRLKAISFLEKYNDLLNLNEDPKILNSKGAEAIIKYLVEKTQAVNHKIMILIDEYDNFANDLIGTGNDDLYYDILQSEGYVRVFFKAIKDGTSQCISRVFITGVSPIMLDDLTSGFNITENFTTLKSLNEMMGFTEEEVREIIRELEADKIYSLDKLIPIMKEYFNGYLFNGRASQRVYNTDMVLYFLNLLIREQRIPENILDQNVRTDYRKLQQMAFSFKDEELIDKLIKEGEVLSSLVDRFNLEVMYNKRENFISLLFYLGMLTIKRVEENDLYFEIPNYAIKKIYWEYFQSKIENEANIRREEYKPAIKQMRKEGNIKPFMDYVMRILKKLSNRDLQKFDEKYVKAVILTLINMDGIFMIESEYEAENGYIDILLTKDVRWAEFVNYEWVLELKYLKKSDKDKLEKVKKEGHRQLDKYVEDKVKGKVEVENLKTALIIVIGKDEMIVERGKLQDES